MNTRISTCGKEADAADIGVPPQASEKRSACDSMTQFTMGALGESEQGEGVCALQDAYTSTMFIMQIPQAFTRSANNPFPN